jgi:hypothetical protein
MKKISLSVVTVLLFISTVRSQDKAFEKGDITVDIGIGIGVYGTKIHEEYNEDRFNLLTGFETVRVKHDTTDAAASVIYPLRLEYGVTNWLGIGARIAYSNYFVEKDTINNYQSKVHGIDADFLANFHLIKSKRFDMPVCLSIGYSNIKYMANDPYSHQAKGNGLNFGLSLMPHIYFGDHIGMYFNIGYAGYNYPNLKFSNNQDSNLNDENDLIYKLKGNGLNLGLGLVGKF